LGSPLASLPGLPQRRHADKGLRSLNAPQSHDGLYTKPPEPPGPPRKARRVLRLPDSGPPRACLVPPWSSGGEHSRSMQSAPSGMHGRRRFSLNGSSHGLAVVMQSGHTPLGTCLGPAPTEQDSDAPIIRPKCGRFGRCACFPSGFWYSQRMHHGRH